VPFFGESAQVPHGYAVVEPCNPGRKPVWLAVERHPTRPALLDVQIVCLDQPETLDAASYHTLEQNLNSGAMSYFNDVRLAYRVGTCVCAWGASMAASTLTPLESCVVRARDSGCVIGVVDLFSSVGPRRQPTKVHGLAIYRHYWIAIL
jgi:hypothetical protein